MDSINLNVEDILQAIDLQNVQVFLKDSESTARAYQDATSTHSILIQSISKSLDIGFDEEESDLDKKLDRLVQKFESIQEQYYTR